MMDDMRKENVTMEDEIWYAVTRWQLTETSATGMWGDKMTAAVTSSWGKRAPPVRDVRDKMTANKQLTEMSSAVILSLEK